MSGGPAPATPTPAGTSGRTALEVAEEASRAAGRIIMDRFVAATGAEPAQTVQVGYKEPDHIVTDVDHEAERTIIEILAREFPGYGVLAEESGRTAGRGEFTWVVDPLDGTRNFAAGIPHFAVSIALARGDDVLLGLIYDPARDELFHAEAGRGAYLNGVRVAVSDVESLERSIVGFDIGPIDEKAGRLLNLLRELWREILAIRILGSATLGYAYAAAGRVQLYAHHHQAPWDVAAGLLLVREAGGVVTDLQGAQARMESTAAAAGNETLHAQFMAATEGSAWRDIGA